ALALGNLGISGLGRARALLELTASPAQGCGLVREGLGRRTHSGALAGEELCDLLFAGHAVVLAAMAPNATRRHVTIVTTLARPASRARRRAPLRACSPRRPSGRSKPPGPRRSSRPRRRARWPWPQLRARMTGSGRRGS